MSKITSIGLGIPEKSYTQSYMFESLGHRKIYKRIFDAAGIKKRHLCLDPREMVKTSAQDLNNNYKRFALDLSVKALLNCLNKASLEPKDIDALVYVSCTGPFESPAMGWEIAYHLNMAEDVYHIPISGAGCAGAGFGLQVAWEHSRLFPEDKIAVITTEISNAAYHPDSDLGVITGNGIFADGSSCYLVEGNSPKNGISLLDFLNYHDYANRNEVAMILKDARYRLVLPKNTSALSTPAAKKVADMILMRNGWTKDDIKQWVIHSGGLSILDDFSKAMSIETEKLLYSYYVWQNFGNMSSATVGFALSELMDSNDFKLGDNIIVITLGAGFTAIAIQGMWIG